MIQEKGERKTKWVICTEVGGMSFLAHVRNGENVDVPVFTVCLSMAKRFDSLGDLMEVLAMIPPRLEAYEEDLGFIQWMDAHEFPETPDNSF